MYGMAVLPAIEAMLTTRPNPRAIISGRASRVA